MSLIAPTGSDAGGSIVGDAEGLGVSKIDSIIGVAIFVLSSAYLCLFLRFTVLNSDEGISLQGAQRILAGQVLYRDFFAFYTPGSYYWTALLFRVFGSSFGVARAALIVYGGIFSSATYLLSRRVCSRVSSPLAAFSTLPLRFASLLGALAMAVAVLFGIYSLYVRFVSHEAPQGFTALVYLLTFFAGIILFFLGVVGEYIGRIYAEVKARPTYIVGAVFGNLDPSPASERRSEVAAAGRRIDL